MKRFSFVKTFLLSCCILGVNGCSSVSKTVIKKLDSTTIRIASNSTDIKPLGKISTFKKETLNDKQKKVVHKFAPILFQETDKKGNPANWDFVTSIDFDGDLKSNNNEESLKSNNYKLPATVYYSLIESETHYFITYSFFHPLDWSRVWAIVPFSWHENDMENIQIVVKKSDKEENEKVVLLSAQAHLDTDVLSSDNTLISSGKRKLSNKKFRLLTKDLSDNGTHTGVYVESGGHGIYSMTVKESRFKNLKNPKLNEGLTLIPAEYGSNIPDNFSNDKDTFTYQLKSTYDEIWANYVNNENMGDGKLVDGYFNYKDELVDFKSIPRHFDSDRVSGPGKSDSGILPFAFSYSLRDSDLGVIFFNPAKKYGETLNINDKWSRNYIYNPYIKNSNEIKVANSLK